MEFMFCVDLEEKRQILPYATLKDPFL